MHADRSLSCQLSLTSNVGFEMVMLLLLQSSCHISKLLGFNDTYISSIF